MGTREKLVYHFHDATYHDFNEIVTSLRTAIGYLSQVYIYNKYQCIILSHYSL